ncbi:hypothetical protein [Formosa sp. L2A11]|uniref:hypothetical protein n=1 Tax=Formosa sp. L2A11 TaxID=2686363 RepID=UPI00131B689E|nr:hypothetical protein [Formosa sp. L2A11]
MNIKKKALTLLFLTLCTVGFSQDYKTDIKSEFQAYLSTIENMEFEKSMDYITPDFFEVVPKANMLAAIKQSYNKKDVEVKILNSKIVSVADAEHIEGKDYALVTYSDQMNIKINNENEETESQKEARINLTKVTFDQSFGAENVVYNKDTEFFEVKTVKQAYAISDDGKATWKFLMFEKNLKTILVKVLPPSLMEKL